MTNSKLKAKLQSLGACRSAMDWLGKRNSREMYDDCERGDWLFWLAARVDIDHKLIAAGACECARLVLHLFEEKYPNDSRPRKAIETTEAWVAGNSSIKDVRRAAYAARADAAAYAADAAYAAAYAAYAAYAAAYDAAYAAAYAAYAARAATDAAYAAYAAAYAAYAARAAARTQMQKQTADIFRKHISFEILEAKL